MATLKEALQKRIPKELEKYLPHSFDTVGDIAIFTNLDSRLKKYEMIIGKTLLDLNKNIKVVAKKSELYSGTYRTPKLKILAGEKRKTTLHKENGISLMLNPETCYFSPRSATERMRIASLVKPNETVLVMFSGIAPFPCVISRHSKAKEIYAIEINPEAHKFAEENVKLNKIKNIRLFKGNVRKVLPIIDKKFDRIIMPLPKSASTFLDLAKKYLKNNGVIHFYDFQKEQDFPKKSIKKIEKHFSHFKVLNAVKCGQFAPGKFRVCIDFKV